MDTFYPLARNCLGICGQDDAGRIGGGRSGRNRPTGGFSLCWMTKQAGFGIGIPFFFQEGMPVSKNRCAESANRCLASLAMLLFIKT